MTDSFKLSVRPLTNRALCFGCYEGRHGNVINRQRRFINSNNETLYDEIICEGCDMVMGLFRPFIPEVIQTYSHEGDIIWIIESRIYLTWKHLFDSIISNSFPEIRVGGSLDNGFTGKEDKEDNRIVTMRFSDGDRDPEDIMRVLLKIGATLPEPRDDSSDFDSKPEVNFANIDWDKTVEWRNRHDRKEIKK